MPLQPCTPSTPPDGSRSPNGSRSHPCSLGLQVFRLDGLLSLQRVPDFTDPSKTVDQYGQDWFEGAIARPGKVLKDIVRAVQGQVRAWSL